MHSSVEGHLGYLQLLAIINMAAMNTVEHVPLLHVGASSGYMSRSGIAGSSGSTISNLLRNHKTDFQSCLPDCNPTSFSTFSPASAVILVFYLSHSDWCEVVSQGCFYLHFPND